METFKEGERVRIRAYSGVLELTGTVLTPLVGGVDLYVLINGIEQPMSFVRRADLYYILEDDDDYHDPSAGAAAHIERITVQ